MQPKHKKRKAGEDEQDSSLICIWASTCPLPGEAPLLGHCFLGHSGELWQGSQILPSIHPLVPDKLFLKTPSPHLLCRRVTWTRFLCGQLLWRETGINRCTECPEHTLVELKLELRKCLTQTQPRMKRKRFITCSWRVVGSTRKHLRNRSQCCYIVR